MMTLKLLNSVSTFGNFTQILSLAKIIVIAGLRFKVIDRVYVKVICYVYISSQGKDCEWQRLGVFYVFLPHRSLLKPDQTQLSQPLLVCHVLPLFAHFGSMTLD